MQLKDYQQKALDQLDDYLRELQQARLDGKKVAWALKNQGIELPAEVKNYPVTAWKKLKDGPDPLSVSGSGADDTAQGYVSRTATSGEPIPHVCLKIPTGGGKTFLGVAALEKIQQGGRGFVLWVVPTRAIYEQTLKSFRNREHPYRESLERISGGRVKLLEKSGQFTKQDVENYLCLMLLMFPAANRQKNREFLKIFRDSGNYASFFPKEDDLTKNQEFLEKYPDLEKHSESECVKQSLINTLKLIRPTVVLDEAHKAYGKNDEKNKEFVQSINRLNPRFVLELSATPKVGISNILVDVSGLDLQREEMIKLPVEIHSFGNSNWKHTLSKAKEKLGQLASETRELQAENNRYVRPIALVRVQRTGKGQQGKGMIHAEDVKKYLIENLSVQENQIKIQSSERKELQGENLLSEMSSVQWIITKDALKEGWDCSFAYVLVLLDETTASTAITQMVGRVMRQPHARNIEGHDALNRCYIYCFNQDVNQAVQHVKTGLENEGLTGLGGFVSSGTEREFLKTPVKFRKKYKKLKIFLPQVLHKSGKKWRLIDYDQDILSAINWSKVNSSNVVDLTDKDVMRESAFSVDIHGDKLIYEGKVNTGEGLTIDYFVRQLIDIIPNPWQASRIASSFLKKHQGQGHRDSDLLNNRIYLSEILHRSIKNKIDAKAEVVFREKLKEDQIRFHLEADENLDYLVKSFEMYVSEDDTLSQQGRPVQKSLFEPVFKSDFNEFEKKFAFHLENSDAIYWWHRIAASQTGYHLRGWKRQRIYPDFLACLNHDKKLLILEIKGKHLKGNEDTKYKEELLKILGEAYKGALDRGVMKVGDPPAEYRMLFEDNWKEELGGLLK